MRKKQSIYLIGIRLTGSSRMTPTGWPRILRRFLATRFPKTLSVICSTAAPVRRPDFCDSSHRPHASNSFAWRNHKKLILRGKNLTEGYRVTILSGVKKIHPAKVRAVDRRGLAKHGK